ncbi:hypothetical protein CANTEDRAFT_132937 [Yamadazyma tenuis ATCC 10573]|uniref:SAC3/GANP/THP3 conserved domain-containing protein n=1 Tax=Candida tenuis (strain ATCC 10573 / BCRC 21748 / CBS 615 / JCM 9827 / NBRC 10315 / NRRL Y-1498 / VKM Y-70) TaxID=590646 RepID=G3AX37_CANTC|nr:uncharacterized protein CANTEDRAFT_132937 [Yamadazyma tenuis ATCC 10573]EGV66680.1 hypothetical protein CANTEDRAFT_132937 [Yamadazyma tenuis ATCC 10573]
MKTSSEGTSETPDQRWPSSLEKFVSDSFVKSGALNPHEKLIFHQQIKELLEKAEAQNKVFSNNWEMQKLPIFHPGLPLDLCSNISFSSPESSVKRKKESQNKKRATLSPPELTPKMHDSEHKKPQNKKYDSDHKKRQRLERFSSPDLPSKPVLSTETTKNGAIVGRSQVIEKRYLRLTSEPDPNSVRPQAVLQQAVTRLLDLTNTKPYSYIKDQFKAIRQDLTVQHIKNDFSMYVYETNARLSIRNNDLGEMNQCVTQIEYLFDSKQERNSRLNRLELEFMCYRILYMLMVGNHSEIFKIKYKLLKKQYQHPEEVDMLRYAQLAFDLQNSMLTSNFYSFFQIAEKFKTMELGSILIQNYLIEKEKIKTLDILAKSYKKLSEDFAMC